MRAARFHAHGGPDVLRYEEAPDPAAAPGQVVVRVRACALNHLDLYQRRGLERVTIPFPHISGADVSGEVADAPGGEFATGTRVLLQPGLSCGRCAACLGGIDNMCARYDVLGYQSDGGYAELVRVPAVNVVPMPDHVSFVDAATNRYTTIEGDCRVVYRGEGQDPEGESGTRAAPPAATLPDVAAQPATDPAP